MARKLVCECRTIKEDDGSLSLVPVIPFTDFPPGDRSAEPNNDGILSWYVTDSEP